MSGTGAVSGTAVIMFEWNVRYSVYCACVYMALCACVRLDVPLSACLCMLFVFCAIQSDPSALICTSVCIRRLRRLLIVCPVFPETIVNL